jgi:hypothetical protein
MLTREWAVRCGEAPAGDATHIVEGILPVLFAGLYQRWACVDQGRLPTLPVAHGNATFTNVVMQNQMHQVLPLRFSLMFGA